jgi:autophagy-related protein 11
VNVKASFVHLERLKEIPTAYVAAVIEVVRRKAFSTFLFDWTTRLSETLTGFTEDERKRRVGLMTGTISHLPFTVPGLDETLAPSVQLSLINGAEALSAISLEQSDVESE